MALIAFMQAQNTSLYVGAWRQIAAMTDFLTPDYYARIARTLEDARFDMAFFDDRLAMPDIYGRSHELAVRHGIRPVKMDPTPILMAMASETTHLGLGATYSTTYHEPFHVARLFATLDLMTRGRIAWNVVTSLNDSEAANFGVSEHLEHDLRYDRADEFLEVVTDMWAAWEADAMVLDKDSGLFADPAKVHATAFAGKFFNTHGTFPVPRSPRDSPCSCKPERADEACVSPGAGPRWSSPHSQTRRAASPSTVRFAKLSRTLAAIRTASQLFRQSL